jgi:predicted Zn-dependent protease
VTSHNDVGTLGESGTAGERDPSSVEPARPIPSGVGFAARGTGVRDAWIVAALVALFVLVVRASLAPMASWLVAQIPYAIDESIGGRLADVQRLTHGTIEDARTEKLRAVVAEVAARVRALAPSSPITASPRVTLLDTDDVNALALPGGEIFVLRGLVDDPAVDNDVLFGVLAHELAHAAGRHGIRGIVRRHLLRSVAVVLFGGLDAGTVALVGQGLSLGDLAYDRAMEEEADDVAGRALLAAGRPVEPLAKFLEKLETAGPTVALFQNHPAGRDRAAALRALAVTR